MPEIKARRMRRIVHYRGRLTPCIGWIRSFEYWYPGRELNTPGASVSSLQNGRLERVSTPYQHHAPQVNKLLCSTDRSSFNFATADHPHVFGVLAIRVLTTIAKAQTRRTEMFGYGIIGTIVIIALIVFIVKRI
jgi:hypothetical protein